MKNITLKDIITFLIILLFTYTATSKLIEPQKFVFQMTLAPVPLMKTLAPFLGKIIPIAEILIVLALLTEKFRTKGLYASLFLLAVFEIYIIAMISSGLQLPCACGGVIGKMSWQQHVPFNAFFMIISIIAIVKYKKQKPGQLTLKNPPGLNDLSHV